MWKGKFARWRNWALFRPPSLGWSDPSSSWSAPSRHPLTTEPKLFRPDLQPINTNNNWLFNVNNIVWLRSQQTNLAIIQKWVYLRLNVNQYSFCQFSPTVFMIMILTWKVVFVPGLEFSSAIRSSSAASSSISDPSGAKKVNVRR